jgi:2-methylcitrate dehydratase PrpD
MMTQDDSLTTELARAYHALSFDDVDDETRDAVEVALLDVLGNLLAGTQERQHRTIVDVIGDRAGVSGDATLVGTADSVSPETAAFANAATAHIVVQDDAHRSSGTHPGTVVIPTAFAVGEATEATGEEVFAAIVAGYDVIGRLGSVRRGFNDELPRRPTPVFGPFGAAIAAGKLLDLNPSELASALGVAANLAGGMSQTWVSGTDEYVLHCGFAARHGVEAARFAAAGLAAAPRTLEGEFGFYRAFFGELPSGLLEVTDGLGESFALADVYAKAEPACGLAIGSIQLARRIVAERDDPGGVDSVLICVSDRAASIPGVLHEGPFETPARALMSIPFGVACTLTHGEYSRRTCRKYHDDPAVTSLIDDIVVTTDEAFRKYQTEMTVEFADAGTVTRQCANVDEPTRADIEAKFDLNATAALDAERVEDIRAAIVDLPAAANIRPVLHQLHTSL